MGKLLKIIVGVIVTVFVINMGCGIKRSVDEYTYDFGYGTGTSLHFSSIGMHDDEACLIMKLNFDIDDYALDCGKVYIPMFEHIGSNNIGYVLEK